MKISKKIIYILVAIWLLASLLHFSNSKNKYDDCIENDLLGGARCLP